MRIVFCGSGSLAVPVLRAVVGAGHEAALLITQPERPAGRGGGLRPTPVAVAAGELGLAVRECPDVNAAEAVEEIRDARAQAVCVVDFGQMVRAAAREAAPLGAFNLHASLLPELRGAAPVNWAIVRGYTRTGVTTFSLVDRMDAGPIYLQAEADIRPDETAADLKTRLGELGGQVVCRTLDLLAAGPVAGREQDESKATLAPRLTKADGLIDWSADAVAVRNRIHGVCPWPGGQAVFRRGDGHETPVTIARAAVAEGPAGGEPGTFDADLCVATGRGRVRILQLQPAGKRLMPWTDFRNGYRPGPGDCFRRPSP